LIPAIYRSGNGALLHRHLDDAHGLGAEHARLEDLRIRRWACPAIAHKTALSAGVAR
jgi:hypothetical protein